MLRETVPLWGLLMIVMAVWQVNGDSYLEKKKAFETNILQDSHNYNNCGVKRLKQCLGDLFPIAMFDYNEFDKESKEEFCRLVKEKTAEKLTSAYVCYSIARGQTSGSAENIKPCNDHMPKVLPMDPPKMRLECVCNVAGLRSCLGTLSFLVDYWLVRQGWHFVDLETRKDNCKGVREQTEGELKTAYDCFDNIRETTGSIQICDKFPKKMLLSPRELKAMCGCYPPCLYGCFRQLKDYMYYYPEPDNVDDNMEATPKFITERDNFCRLLNTYSMRDLREHRRCFDGERSALRERCPNAVDEPYLSPSSARQVCRSRCANIGDAIKCFSANEGLDELERMVGEGGYTNDICGKISTMKQCIDGHIESCDLIKPHVKERKGKVDSLKEKCNAHTKKEVRKRADQQIIAVKRSTENRMRNRRRAEYPKVITDLFTNDLCNAEQTVAVERSMRSRRRLEQPEVNVRFTDDKSNAEQTVAETSSHLSSKTFRRR